MASSWADWVVGLFSPQAAARRMHFRRLEQDEHYRDSVFTVMRTYGYSAAVPGQNKTPWTASMTPRSADAELLLSLPRLREYSRELSRNNALGAGILQSRTRKVVGSGITCQARTTDLEKDRSIELAWYEVCDELSPVDRLASGALQRMRFRRYIEDGEVLVKLSVYPGIDHLCSETIEADRLGTPMDSLPEDPEGQIREGVETDRYGIVRAYWVAKWHPGDTQLPMIKGRRPFVVALTKQHFERVPAEYAFYLKRIDRPGQSRGVPLLHAVMQDLHDLDLYIVASLKRSQVAACLAAFIKSPVSPEDIFNLTAQKYGFQLDQDLVPGMLWKLFPGESVETLTPNYPTAEFVPFVQFLVQRIGAGIGEPAISVLRDWAQSNYSSARTTVLDTRITYALERADFLSLLTWERMAILEDMALRGHPLLRGTTPEDYQEVQWIADAEPWIDPENEAAAIQKQLGMGLTCLRDEAAKLGRDWEDLLNQRLVEQVFERDKRILLGIPANDPDVRLTNLQEVHGTPSTLVTAPGGGGEGGGGDDEKTSAKRQEEAGKYEDLPAQDKTYT